FALKLRAAMLSADEQPDSVEFLPLFRPRIRLRVSNGKAVWCVLASAPSSLPRAAFHPRRGADAFCRCGRQRGGVRDPEWRPAETAPLPAAGLARRRLAHGARCEP